MAVDTEGLGRTQTVTTFGGEREAKLAQLRMHVRTPSGRTVQIMPGNDARSEIPEGEIVWHEKMGISPQEAALLDSGSLQAEIDKAEAEVERLKAAQRKAQDTQTRDTAADASKVRTAIKPGPEPKQPAKP